MAALTWLARGAEVGAPLALVGVVGRWSAARFAPLSGRRRALFRGSLLVALISASFLVYATGAPRIVPVDSPALALACWVGVLGGTWWLWSRARCAGTIDPAWLGRWIYGRRIWLSAAALLMLGMWSLMNIGTFHPVMLASLIPFFRGEEVAAALRWIRRRPAASEPDPAPAPALAYSPRARAIAGALIGFHLVAVGVVLLPVDGHTDAFRSRMGVVVGPWLLATRTMQTWGMWAKPPHDDVFLKAIVVDAAGDAWDLRTDLYAPERRPPPPLGYDRWWKIAERLVKSKAPASYRPAYARWLCRAYDGPAPAVTIELREVKVPIPTPEENRRVGGYDPEAQLERAAEERVVDTHACP